MHFSKSYTQILLSLPPELRENAIEYRQLKKLINQVVQELTSLGLSPETLHQLLDAQASQDSSSARITYEFNAESDEIEPQLRICGELSQLPQSTSTNGIVAEPEGQAEPTDGSSPADDHASHSSEEKVIPLMSDTAFFHLLSSALKSLTERLERTQADFIATLKQLSNQIASTSLPASSSARFRPYSGLTTNASTIHVSSRVLEKSDLDAWRAIFQLYVDSEIFESISESDRGERTVEESERRLTLFAKTASESGLHVRLPQSRQALSTFLEMNMFILNIKKLQLANSEATRKILKKHTKRTALPLPAESGSIILKKTTSLPHIFVQAIGEKLLPIIPPIDDYACLICTALAFKPIRLGCGHLFCVRCLIKMQKRGQGDCPMCRSQTVLTADRTNVDWALLNFMQDWFPTEAREKMLTNEKEAMEEEMRELGLEQGSCVIM